MACPPAAASPPHRTRTHSPVSGASVALTGCVDPFPPHNTPVVTGADGVASFANNPIQFCYHVALETCGWTVSYNGAPGAFTGPTVSVLPSSRRLLALPTPLVHTC